MIGDVSRMMDDVLFSKTELDILDRCKSSFIKTYSSAIPSALTNPPLLDHLSVRYMYGIHKTRVEDIFGDPDQKTALYTLLSKLNAKLQLNPQLQKELENYIVDNSVPEIEMISQLCRHYYHNGYEMGCWINENTECVVFALNQALNYSNICVIYKPRWQDFINILSIVKSQKPISKPDYIDKKGTIESNNVFYSYKLDLLSNNKKLKVYKTCPICGIYTNDSICVMCGRC